MKKIEVSGRTLNDAEQKNILGGYAHPGGDGYPSYLECTTPGGTERWRRNCTSANATADCKAIYPAWGNNVTGECYLIIS